MDLLPEQLAELIELHRELGEDLEPLEEYAEACGFGRISATRPLTVPKHRPRAIEITRTTTIRLVP